MPTYSIHIAGQVQGIGFRPYAYRLAKKYGLNGWVRNQADGVHMKVQGHEQQVQSFYEELTTQAPDLAKIQSSSIKQVENKVFQGFEIRKETKGTTANLMLTPDLAMCDACRQEMNDSKNRRFGYAFTTCTSCGPRYSIMAKLPYEREHTTMAPFTMCAACEKEYHDPENRRYYSQTNSCPVCPVTLGLYDMQQQLLSDDQQESIAVTVNLLAAGKIVAVKGLGGYLLMADATNAQTIQTLRERKHRAAKPFALMYPDLEMAQQDVLLQEDEQELLLSSVSPIVLAQKKTEPASGIKADLIAPQLNKLGLMLPYTPLFELLLAQLQKPVIATSANRHGTHIIYKDTDAFEQLASIADYILLHNREILVSQDDSVVQFTPKHRQRIMLRRSRGYAPSFVGGAPDQQSWLATGADMKSTFAFTTQGNSYVSQYLGDLSVYDNTLNFEHSLQHLKKLLDFHPSLLLTDKHPGYTSVRLGKELTQKYKVPHVQVQHHEAHFADVLAENELLNSDEPVLGVIWDGTGYGNDKLIRGGEFFLYQDLQISPLAQMEPYPHLSGDKMAKEPRLAALALCFGLKDADILIKPYFTEAEWKFYQSILDTDKYKLQTTSMGREFDAVAALLGLCGRMSYEGEAAMLLESLAAQEPAIYDLQDYTLAEFNGNEIPFKTILGQMLADVRQGENKVRIAARFHVTLVKIVSLVAEHYSIKKLSFSGGVFQNSLLVDLLIDKLSPEFKLYFHKQLSPNDECISFGQLAWMQLKYKTVAAPEEQHTVHHTLKI
ncbi:carbamoyltransferase HypF [Pontibacter anaerobius]|uniref:Carbamoyltransferase n=1 Tax=Pontibacter anaerobius TaxID=2993940 RepID=A0ABT3RE93_9BACT|nr:carbamoyltransferase HypF [Pontibacter anaerobius]